MSKLQQCLVFSSQQKPTSGSIQLHYIPVTAFSKTYLLPWECYDQSQEKSVALQDGTVILSPKKRFTINWSVCKKFRAWDPSRGTAYAYSYPTAPARRCYEIAFSEKCGNNINSHSRTQSCDPLGQRHGSIRGAGQEDRSSGYENASVLRKPRMRKQTPKLP